MTNNYRIKDLESITGVKAHTIRIWEQRYGIVIPKRSETKIRYYSDSDARLLMNVAILNKNGYKISHIKTMTLQQIASEAARFTLSISEYSSQIDSLVSTMLDYDETRFETIIHKNFSQNGFEKTFINVVFPFLSRIGSMWQTGAITPAQEHFMSNLIRQKIIVAINNIIAPESISPLKKVLLFLPEKEQHEISLLFTHYLFKSRGYQTYYLGQQTPLSEVIKVYEKHLPEYLFSVYSTSTNGVDLFEFTKKLSVACSKSKIFLTGIQAISQKKIWPSNVSLIFSIDDMYRVFDSDNNVSSSTQD